MGHVFEGEFEEMHISEVMTDVIGYDDVFTVFSRREKQLISLRFTFWNVTSISYQHQFSIHQKPNDDPSEKSVRWQSIVTNVARFVRGATLPSVKTKSRN